MKPIFANEWKSSNIPRDTCLNCIHYIHPRRCPHIPIQNPSESVVVSFISNENRTNVSPSQLDGNNLTPLCPPPQLSQTLNHPPPKWHVGQDSRIVCYQSKYCINLSFPPIHFSNSLTIPLTPHFPHLPSKSISFGDHSSTNTPPTIPRDWPDVPWPIHSSPRARSAQPFDRGTRG